MFYTNKTLTSFENKTKSAISDTAYAYIVYRPKLKFNSTETLLHSKCICAYLTINLLSRTHTSCGYF